MADYHLAQFNIARLAYPIDDPRVAGFVEQLDPVNRLADDAPGFVWRHQTEHGDSTSLRPYDDDAIIINFSMWDSIEALHQFTYSGEHMAVFEQRQKWFANLRQRKLVMWWHPAGSIPSVAEGKAKLEALNEHGATPLAFTFAKRFTVDEMLAYQQT